MKVYRIKLVGHDLYYQPVKGRWTGEKSNLAELGKVYLKKPTLKHIGSVHVSDSIVEKHDLKYCDACKTLRTWGGKTKTQYRISNPELEIVEYDCVEVK